MTAGNNKWIGQSVERLEDPPLVTRPRPLRRRHHISAPAPHADRALEPRPRPDRLDRHVEPRARCPGVVAVWTAADIADVAADRFPRGTRSRSSSPTGSRCWRPTRCAMSASRSPRCSPKIPMWPRTPPISSPWRSRNCRSLLDADARAGRILVRPQHRGGHHPSRLRRRRCGVPVRAHDRRARARHRPALRRAAGSARRASAATTPRATSWNCTAPPRCRTATATCSRACSSRTPSSVHVHEVACRRRLRHPRRALSRGRAGLRRRHAPRAAGEMDRGPARAPDRRQPFAPAAPPHPRGAATDEGESSPSTTLFSRPRRLCAHPCHPRRAHDLRHAAGPVSRAGLSRGRPLPPDQQDAGRDLSRAGPLRDHVRARAAGRRHRAPSSARSDRRAPPQRRHAGRDAVQAAARGAGRGDRFRFRRLSRAARQARW